MKGLAREPNFRFRLKRTCYEEDRHYSWGVHQKNKVPCPLNEGGPSGSASKKNQEGGPMSAGFVDRTSRRSGGTGREGLQGSDHLDEKGSVCLC